MSDINNIKLEPHIHIGRKSSQGEDKVTLRVSGDENSFDNCGVEGGTEVSGQSNKFKDCDLE